MGALFYVVLRGRGQVGSATAGRMGMMLVLMVLQGFADTGTDNAAHIGGLAAGFLLAVLLYRKKRRNPDPEPGNCDIMIGEYSRFRTRQKESRAGRANRQEAR